MVVITTLWNLWARSKSVRLGQLLLAAHLVALGGCDTLNFGLLQTRDPGPTAAADSLVLRPDGFAQEKAPAGDLPEAETNKLARAREYFRAQEYAKAEDFFNSVADREKNPPVIVQEAMYYRAECLRLQGHLPKAVDTYMSLLNKFPNNPYREQCVQHLFDIANRWLDDTRQAMREDKEGKTWFTLPRFVSFEKSKPLLDREGRALNTLEQVRVHDINGPLADRSLFLCGVVQMYNENYRDADMYFTQIYARHPESKLAPKSIELAIQCKHMSTGGSDYDGRKTAEARKMIQTALNNYPEMAHNKEMVRFLEDQRASIDLQQAEKEFNMAEFYRRRGHPGSAYFYYELVRRRYPNTKYARLAEERWNSLREKLEKNEGGLFSSPAPTGAPTPATGGLR
jgi:outer membrane protein assembly factor BamD (BamD/ComL family)